MPTTISLLFYFKNSMMMVWTGHDTWVSLSGQWFCCRLISRPDSW
jgi:hypothetical protein